MTRHKSFGNLNPYEDAEPVTFDIYDETFTCLPAVQGSTLLKFGREAKENAEQAILDFFRICMPEDEYLRFEELIESPDKIIDARTLSEIASWLVSEYTARPTGPSSSSSTGPVTTGRTSGKRR